MTAADDQGSFFTGAGVDGLLLLRNGGGGLNGTAEDYRHAVGDAAVHTAVIVGCGHWPAVLHPDGIVCLTAGHIRKGKPGSEFNALDSGDGEERMGKDAFDRVEPGFTDACRQTGNGGFQNATHAVTSGSSIFNRFTHGLAFCFIQNGKGQAVQPGQIHGQIREGSIINAGTAGNMGADHNSFAPQGSNHNSAGGHQRGCDPAAEMAAATVVFIAMILGIGCEIRMPGPGRAALIISAAGVRIGNQDCHRGTGGTAFKNAADNPEGIGFLPGSGNTAGRTAKSQLGSDKFLIHRDAGRKAVDDRADFGSVAFTEQCDGEGSAKGVFHNNSHIFYS